MTQPPMNLIERITSAEGGSRQLDAEIALALGIVRERGYYDHDGSAPELPHYTTSVDAAVSLVPDRYRDDWLVAADGPRTYGKPIAWLGISWFDDGEADHSTTASSPALALCAAALTARGVS